MPFQIGELLKGMQSNIDLATARVSLFRATVAEVDATNNRVRLIRDGSTIAEEQWRPVLGGTPPAVGSRANCLPYHAPQGQTPNIAVVGERAPEHTHPHSDLTGVDTDAATTAIHHTLGAGATQAAAGSHGHTQLHDPVTLLNTTTVELAFVTPGVSGTQHIYAYIPTGGVDWTRLGQSSKDHQKVYTGSSSATHSTTSMSAYTTHLLLTCALPPGTYTLHIQAGADLKNNSAASGSLLVVDVNGVIWATRTGNPVQSTADTWRRFDMTVPVSNVSGSQVVSLQFRSVLTANTTTCTNGTIFVIAERTA